MIDSRFEYISNLQYEVHCLRTRLEAFTTGEKYLRMRAEFKSCFTAQNAIIRKLKAELADARMQQAAVRRNLLEVAEDLEREHARQLRKKDREIEELRQRASKAEQQRDEAKAVLREKMSELYEVKTQLEDVKGKNQKLISQINRDYENSSIPSSSKLNRKKITNNREKTGRKPGAQPGHKGHPRKKLTPTSKTHIPPPPEYLDITQYRPTGKIITKQMINLQLRVIVEEFDTPEFRNVKTGQRVHAEFPAGMINDLTYGGSVKSFVFLLNNHCNSSVDKTRELLLELTGGQLQISNGMINGLSREFSDKTQPQQKEIIANLLLSPVMNVDFANARACGNNSNVGVCAAPGNAMYFAREHKGHKGVAGSPAEDYQNILVHDHDKTFYNYGSDHQECAAHVLRYLKNSMENEPDRQWNKRMRGLLQEAIHLRNSTRPGADPDPVEVEKIEASYGTDTTCTVGWISICIIICCFCTIPSFRQPTASANGF